MYLELSENLKKAEEPCIVQSYWHDVVHSNKVLQETANKRHPKEGSILKTSSSVGYNLFPRLSPLNCDS